MYGAQGAGVPVTRLAVILLLVIAACTTGRPSRPGSSPAQRTTLQVDNQGFVDMVVYIVTGSQRIRIGLAVGKTTTVMTIPARVLGQARELQFLADPIGSDRQSVSDRIYVRAGDAVRLTIPP